MSVKRIASTAQYAYVTLDNPAGERHRARRCGRVLQGPVARARGGPCRTGDRDRQPRPGLRPPGRRMRGIRRASWRAIRTCPMC